MKRALGDIVAIVIFVLFAVGVFQLLRVVVGEGEDGRRDGALRNSNSTVASPSPTFVQGGDLSLSKRGVDSVAATVLHGYLTGGPEKASFIIRDVQNRTGCVVLHGRLGDIRGVRDGFEADTRELERRYGAMVGSATEDGAGINLVFDCP